MILPCLRLASPSKSRCQARQIMLCISQDLLGLQRRVGSLHVHIEFRWPADGGASFGVVPFSPFGEHSFVADDVGHEVEQTLRHLFFDE